MPPRKLLTLVLTERARSLSPTKDSPASTPPPLRYSEQETPTSLHEKLQPAMDLRHPDELSSHDDSTTSTLQRRSGSPSPSKENAPIGSENISESSDRGMSSTRNSPSAAI